MKLRRANEDNGFISTPCVLNAAAFMKLLRANEDNRFISTPGSLNID
jgi:hypothetical protein